MNLDIKPITQKDRVVLVFSPTAAEQLLKDVKYANNTRRIPNRYTISNVGLIQSALETFNRKLNRLKKATR